MSHPRSSSATDPDSDEQDQEALLTTFLATTQHFFGSVTDLFAPIADPRQPELITYPLAAAPNQSVLPGQWAVRDEIRSALRRCDLSARRHPQRGV